MIIIIIKLPRKKGTNKTAWEVLHCPMHIFSKNKNNNNNIKIES